tara:strand:- start:51 stop:239 length:189 start_codon:yes stop_codon:yes gene_type:complete
MVGGFLVPPLFHCLIDFWVQPMPGVEAPFLLLEFYQHWIALVQIVLMVNLTTRRAEGIRIRF